MDFIREHLDKFQELFRGNPNAHGVHVPEKNVEEGKKAKGKSFTKTAPITIEDYILFLQTIRQ